MTGPREGQRAPAGGASVSDVVMRALAEIHADQLEHGEMPGYVSEGARSLVYVRSPRLSAYVHDALGALDPGSRAFDSFALDAIDAASRASAARLTADVRRGIRSFLAWQEDGSGAWLLHGRGSAAVPDLDTTASAALALSDQTSAVYQLAARRRSQRVRGLLDESGDALSVVALVNGLRCMMRLGGAVEQLDDRLDRGLDAAVAAVGYVQPEVALYFVARLDREHPDVLRPGVRRRVLAAAEEQTLVEKALENPLGAAFVLSAWIDLDVPGDQIAVVCDRLRRMETSAAGWPFQSLFAPAQGAPALTAAFVASTLARAHGRLRS